jgi:hypothetical protein
MKLFRHHWALGLIAVLAFGTSLFAQSADEKPLDPLGVLLAQKYVDSVILVQSETSLPELAQMKVNVSENANTQANKLNFLKEEVENKRNRIKEVDGKILDARVKLGIESDPEKSVQLKNDINNLTREREERVEEEAAGYKAYARQRGLCFAYKIIAQLILKEIDKRIAELGPNTAFGNWAGTYTEKGGEKTLASGTFSLLIDAKTGAIGGSYVNGQAVIPVKGTWNQASGACSGQGSENAAATSFSGTLTRGDTGYSGGGSFSYTDNDGGSGAGAWKTK